MRREGDRLIIELPVGTDGPAGHTRRAAFARHHGLITCTNCYDQNLAFFRRCAAPGRCRQPTRISMHTPGGVGNRRVCTHFFKTGEDFE